LKICTLFYLYLKLNSFEVTIRSSADPSFKHNDMKAFGEIVVYLRTYLTTALDSGELLVTLFYRVDPGNKLL